MKSIAILQHQSNEDEGFIREWLKHNKLAAEKWRVWQSCEFDDPDNYSAIIVLGGEANVRDREKLSWMQQEISWLGDAIAKSIPIVGICLGAQLMAHILRAKVVELDEPEKGVFSLELNAQTNTLLGNRFLADFGYLLKVIQAHSYRFDVPQNSLLLASTQRCKQQIYYSERHSLLGIQCHLEWSREKAIQLFPNEPSYLEMTAQDEKVAKQFLFQLLDKIILDK
ncbi:MAG: type 1 glutamine amidotransferase [Kangiellaceae bacterium]|nr:type 1 glutamine amidotransferase [Kangiellaceae bacterium]MCW9000024.1 type 1 glutamine amidotransferase [Kangiellaceae bacterium]